MFSSTVFCLSVLSFLPVAKCEEPQQPAVPKEDAFLDAFHNQSIITNHHHLQEELKHHLGDVDLNQMSVEELEFYYFTLHDFDKNTLLDGLEIMIALEESLEEPLATFSKEDMTRLIIEMTDEVLEKDDLDQDGYLSYFEYVHSQKRTASPTTILDKSAKDTSNKGSNTTDN